MKIYLINNMKVLVFIFVNLFRFDVVNTISLRRNCFSKKECQDDNCKDIWSHL